MFKSKKSNKPALDPSRVEQLLGYVDRKYPKDKWEIKTLTAKANQKCRDSGKKTEVEQN